MTSAFSPVMRTVALALALAGLAGLSCLPAAHAEGTLAQLYAARPPAGSSFVRVVHPDAGSLRVKIGDGPEQTLSGSKPADRKSTRLNSSHSQISYAVFCLKKKKKKKHI